VPFCKLSGHRLNTGFPGGLWHSIDPSRQDQPQFTCGYEVAMTSSTNESISWGGNGLAIRGHCGEPKHFPPASSYPDINAVRVVG
jgi:hypothetical protein